MKCVFLIFLIFLTGLVSANTTFFDNPDDVFMMSDSTTGEVAGEITNGEGDSAFCLYKWNCTNWSECLQSGKQIRNCTNNGTCLDTYNPPVTEQNCTYISSEEEKSEETEKIIWEELPNKNKIILYSIIILIALSIILYLKRSYFKKIIKKVRQK